MRLCSLNVKQKEKRIQLSMNGAKETHFLHPGGRRWKLNHLGDGLAGLPEMYESFCGENTREIGLRCDGGLARFPKAVASFSRGTGQLANLLHL